MPGRDNPIGIFDSGVGGLTIMNAIKDLLPNENLIYLADNIHLPYGDKSPETIVNYARKNAEFLIDQGIKLLVVACHTACAHALNELRDSLPISVIGVVQSSVNAVKCVAPKRGLAILGTRGTISSGLYTKLFPELNVYPVACPLFASYIEAKCIEQSHIDDCLRPIQGKPLDAALLACTHYPYIKELLQKSLGESVTLIDPAVTCAMQIQQFLQEHTLTNEQKEEPRHLFFSSDKPCLKEVLSKRSFGDEELFPVMDQLLSR